MIDLSWKKNDKQEINFIQVSQLTDIRNAVQEIWDSVAHRRTGISAGLEIPGTWVVALMRSQAG